MAEPQWKVGWTQLTCMTFSLTCPDGWKHTQMSTGVPAAQVVYTKTAQEENNPRTPATSPPGRWWSPSNAGVPAALLQQSWEEGGAWSGHTHALHSHASPAALYHLFSYYSFPTSLNKGPQWRWAGGWRSQDYDCPSSHRVMLRISKKEFTHRSWGWWYILRPLS